MYKAACIYSISPREYSTVQRKPLLQQCIYWIYSLKNLLRGKQQLHSGTWQRRGIEHLFFKLVAGQFLSLFKKHFSCHFQIHPRNSFLKIFSGHKTGADTVQISYISTDRPPPPPPNLSFSHEKTSNAGNAKNENATCGIRCLLKHESCHSPEAACFLSTTSPRSGVIRPRQLFNSPNSKNKVQELHYFFPIWWNRSGHRAKPTWSCCLNFHALTFMEKKWELLQD